jgi:hypothetical protein
MDVNDLEIGDFILADYGYDAKEFYVYKMTEKKIILGRRSWLNEAAMWVDKSDKMFNDFEFLCKGKFRYWTLFLPIINNGISPFSQVR